MVEMRWVTWIGLALMLAQPGFSSPTLGSGPADSGQLIVTFAEETALSGEEENDEVYVGLVKSGDRFSAPALERMVPGDASWAASVPIGNYRLVCASADKGLSFSKIFEISPGKVAQVECAWPRTSRYEGCIVNQKGDRLPGAVIGPAALFDLTMLNSLSALGTKVVRKAYSAETGEDGCFQLQSPPASKVDLWIESPGFVPARLHRFEIPAAMATPQSLGELEIGPAGTQVELKLQYEGVEDPGDYLVGLSPSTESSPGGAWELPQGATVQPLKPHVMFPGLPEGTYIVWIAARSAESAPRTLGEITVFGGDLVSKSFSVPTVRSQDQGTGRLTFRLEDSAGAHGSLQAVDWSTGSPAPWPQALFRPTDHALDVLETQGCAPGGAIQFVTDGFASPLVELTEEICSRRSVLPLRVFPTIRVRGKVRVPRGYDRPELGRIQLLEVVVGLEEKLGDSSHVFPVHLGEPSQTAWQASIPVSGQKSLRIPGFLAVPLENGDKDQDGVLNFGIQNLRPAATLVVRLTPNSGVQKAELFPASVLDVLISSEFMARGEKPLPATIGFSDESGWLRLGGLKAGEYRLLVSPIDGGQATVSDLLSVEEGEKLLIDPLQVPEPASVEVSLKSTLLNLDGFQTKLAITGSSTCDWKSQIYRETAFDGLGTAQLKSRRHG